MSLPSDWPVVLEIDGLKCPVALGWWKGTESGVLTVVMDGDWYTLVQLKNVDEITVDDVKRALAGMYTARAMAKMPEAIRDLQPKLEAEIDAWFAKQPVM